MLRSLQGQQSQVIGDASCEIQNTGLDHVHDVPCIRSSGRRQNGSQAFVSQLLMAPPGFGHPVAIKHQAVARGQLDGCRCSLPFFERTEETSHVSNLRDRPIDSQEIRMRMSTERQLNNARLRIDSGYGHSTES